MNRLLLHFRSSAAKLGLPGALGIGLLVTAGGFYVSALDSERSRLEELRREIAAAREERSAPAAAALPATPADRLAAFYGFFPRPNDLPDLLEKVYGAAKRHGLQLEQGEYRVAKDSAGALVQFQVTLPVHGTYPQIRKFVDGAMAEVSTLSLESIHFERQKVGDGMIDAKVKLAVYLGRRS
ncbi:MAG: type 4a pilus biogenesis protein PilO [Betaproteobacteria bacterium]|nr:type 4a pilus biogenesis protein PilO [Betaproteobacteria bacterium]MBI2960852.1 type 4a pilus biogenesis protein PilO [Betaproteobacteria bacterium]